MTTPAIPFTPPHVSVNRVQIEDLPGLPLDEAVRGRRAYHLLSAEALVGHALERAAELELPTAFIAEMPESLHYVVPPFVDMCLRSPDAGPRAAAEAIAERLGRNLGYVLLTLHRGDAVNRGSRADWTGRDWQRWADIRQVYVGGGLLSGDLGRLIVDHAAALLRETGYDGALRVLRTPYREDMALLGAGRYFPAGMSRGLCFDFGHTTVKRALLVFDGGTLTQVSPLRPLPTRWVLRNDPAGALTFSGQWVLDFVTGAIVRTLDKREVSGSDLMLSVAAYVQGGRLLGNGIYARMSTLGEDVRLLLQEAVRERTRRVVRIHLIHDGTAASALHAGEPDTAVILVGTALGVGFAPADTAGLRPVAPHLVIADAT